MEQINHLANVKRDSKVRVAYSLIQGVPSKKPITEEQKANFITEVRNDPELNAELEKMLEQIKQ